MNRRKIIKTGILITLLGISSGIYYVAFKVDQVHAYDAREVVLDSGHGGYDPGASGYSMLEKDVSLDITKRVRVYLLKANINVVMTRDTDTSLGNDEGSDLKGRVDVANRTNARYFISIHMNATTEHNANGLEIYHNSQGSDVTEKIHKELVDLNYTKDRGIIKDRRLYVLRKTNMAAALIEVGFIDGNQDAKILSDNEKKEAIAKRIANGIIAQMKEDERKTKKV